ncbi:GNAT family N-acetyltransferase [Burkholderia vietnamiensis]|uniref:GNAT family N-acetyltransferase n=1 Tax=Burkholderia vietnamiensis TaxID=60552 RepID=UPI001B979764|nr:GNAT family N-acetyltransferase [Burkholderia vietnamiensis]MBR8165364.1 GNAT family N-acetyltransferase [Burkholderia vietnamiensis]
MHPYYATAQDIPDVERLFRECDLPVEGIREHIDHYLVSRDSGGVIGCAGLEHYGKVGFLRGIAIARRARMAGLSDFILSILVADARQHGVESLVALSDGVASYFEKIGFTSADASELPPDLRRSLARTSPRVALKIMQVTL